MFKVFRIIFSILAAGAAAAAIFVFVLVGWSWGLITVGLCLLFAALMFLFRNLQTRKELRDNPPPPVGDFITGKVDNDEKE